MRRSAGRPSWTRHLAVGLTLVLGALVVSVGLPVAPVAVPAAAAAPVCTDPPPNGLDAATPAQLRQRYHLNGLFADQHQGQGQVGVILEFGQSVDVAALGNWEACLGAGSPPITQTLVGGGSMPGPGGEAQADAQSMVIGAPGLERLYSLVTNGSEADQLPTLLQGILDGSLTGGRRADVVSLSFGSCEASWVQDGKLGVINGQIEPLLQDLAEAGTWFFKAAGDAGSSDCSPHGSTPNCVNTAFDQQLDAGYPASSPWVTSVGGVQLPDGVEKAAEVWNSRDFDTTDCSAGGGTLSSLFPTPAYQQTVPGGAVPAMRGVPDISALAGRPYYLSYSTANGWYGNGGTSFAAPLYAGAAASVRSALVAAGAPVPKMFNDALYAVANDPATYATVFNDITKGDNVIYDVNTCCVAAHGYDLASGLGELHATELAGVLALQATTPTTTTVPSTVVPPAVTPAFTG
ncbi:MAG: S8 family serine peptidase [Acidimicrobiales bacterium]